MRGIELLVVFKVIALDLAVVAGWRWSDELVSDSQALKFQFKQSWLGHHTIGKFTIVIRLDTFNGKRKFLDHLAQE